MSPAETAEPVEIQCGMLSGAGPENHVLHGSAHWYNLANTIEPFVCGGDADLLWPPYVIGGPLYFCPVVYGRPM